jgi:hypothetical protein
MKVLRCKRILILGSPGSGKSVFSKKLSVSTGLPLYHMDDLYWEKNWKRPEQNEFLSILSAVIEGEYWILDGNYASSLEFRLQRADAVVFLDLPTYQCLINVLIRSLDRFMGDRTTLPSQIRGDATYGPKLSLDFSYIKFLYKVITFKYSTRPEMLRILSKTTLRHRITIFRSRNNANAFLHQCSLGIVC